MKWILPVVLIIALSGCSGKMGTRTINYASDGKTVTSEVYNVEAGELADIEASKAVIECQKRMSSLETARYNNLTDPKDIALLTSIDGLVKGQVGYKDPCAQLRTHIDEEIAESKMWSIGFTGFWETTKTLGLGYFGYKSFDSLVGALSGAGASYLLDTGGGDLSLNDSLNSASFGDIDGSTLGAVLGDGGSSFYEEMNLEYLTEWGGGT